jgi:hypothetical protein
MRYLDPREGAPDGRLFSPVYERNAPPLIATLAPWLAARSGRALEIGSGSGQHIGAFELAFPQLHWQPSDPAPENRRSIAAWRVHLRLPERPALAIDAAQDWAATFEREHTLILSMNVVHIAPIAVLHGLLAGAEHALAAGGLLVLYGPFTEGGQHTGDGNAAFDARLRAEDPSWGIRDADEIVARAAEHGLVAAARQIMPANNRLLVFERRS